MWHWIPAGTRSVNTKACITANGRRQHIECLLSHLRLRAAAAIAASAESGAGRRHAKDSSPSGCCGCRGGIGDAASRAAVPAAAGSGPLTATGSDVSTAFLTPPLGIAAEAAAAEAPSAVLAGCGCGSSGAGGGCAPASTGCLGPADERPRMECSRPCDWVPSAATACFATS